MNLNQLTIENYGVYTSRQLTFGDSGFRLIYGPNEAGKSTLLQLIREMLFGFPHQSSFAFANHSGKLAATLRATLSDGRRFHYRRHKGRTGTVVGEFDQTGESIDTDTLASLLSGAGSELYHHVFGFSLEELNAGEKSLQHANLNEALYGGGIGGLSNFQDVRRAIRDEHSSMYSSRAKKPAINAALIQIREKTKQLRECTIRPTDYDERVRRCEELEERAERLQRELADLNVQVQRLHRLSQTADLQARLKVAQEDLAAMPTQESFPVDGVSEFGRFKSQLAESATEVERLQAAIEQKSAERAQLKWSPGLLDSATQILTLSEDVRRIQDFETQIPEHEARIETLRRELSSRISNLNPDWQIDQLEGFRTNVGQRSELQTLSDEFAELERSESISKSQRPELERQLTTSRQRLEALESTETLPALEDLMNRAKDYRSDCRKLAEIEQEVSDQDTDLCHALKRVQSGVELSSGESFDTKSENVFDSAVRFVDRKLPSSVTIDEHLELIAEQKAAIAELNRQLKDVQSQIERFEEELQVVDESPRAVSRQRLLEQRNTRDKTWQRIRRRFVDKTDTDDETIATPEEFERIVASADSMADERQKHAEDVAKREHLEDSVARQKVVRDKTREELNASETQLKKLESDWHELWLTAGLTPDSPAVMKEWLSDVRELEQLIQTRTKTESRRDALQKCIETFAAEAQRSLPTEMNSVDASLAHGNDRLEILRDARSERKRLTHDLPELEARHKTLERELYELSIQKAEWQSRWTETLTQFGLPQTWSASTATDTLRDLGEMLLQRDEALSLEERLKEMQITVNEFQKSVESLAKEIASDLTDLPPSAVCRELGERLENARAASREHESLSRELELLDQQVKAAEPRRKAASDGMNQLFEAAGVSNENEFLTIAESAEQRNKLVASVNELEREIRAICGTDTNDETAVQLAALTVDEIRQQLSALSTQAEQRTGDYKTALQEAGVARKAIEELDNKSRFVELSSELECLRAELSSHVDRWAPLVLMEAMMNNAIRDFEKNHRPRLVAEVSRLFSQITAGRYSGIKRQIDGEATLLAIERNGQVKEPAALSTGTREQLYLAIRLAYVLQYCETSEPLPVVMDDVLVNFDRGRAKETLKALLDISQHVQILFLTCHDHIVELATEIGADADPILLTSATPQIATRMSDIAIDGNSSDTERSGTAPRRSSKQKKKASDAEDHPQLFPGS